MIYNKDSPNCNFQSIQQELIQYNMYKIQQALADPKYKKELCSNFITNGSCKYNYKCRFAHGINDLMGTLSKSKINYDTSDSQYRQQCSNFFKHGVCLKGKNCNYSHRKLSGNSPTSNIFLQMSKKRLQVFENLTDSIDEQSTIENSREDSFVSSTEIIGNYTESERKKSIDSLKKPSVADKKRSKLSLLFEDNTSKSSFNENKQMRREKQTA